MYSTICFVSILLLICLSGKGLGLQLRPALPMGRFPKLTTNGGNIGADFKTNSTLIEVTATATAAAVSAEQLTYMQTLTAGALSRTVAQTLMHPANTYKTMLQLKNSGKIQKLTLARLLRGADAQFLLSLPHGAFYFFVIDQVRDSLSKFVSNRFGFLQDFAASTISTIACSIVSTPQMVLTDRLMAGVYPNFPTALRSIMATEGVAGFYTGWWPALAQKIPSYGLTWVIFQQLKRLHERVFGDKPGGEASFIWGAVAAAASVTVMIPMDTVKTRLVIQMAGCVKPYTGVSDCFFRILREEGVGTFYRSLPPRLMSVVPMIAIQFGVYESMKSHFLEFNREKRAAAAKAIKKRVRTGAVAIANTAKRGAKAASNVNTKVRANARLNREKGKAAKAAKGLASTGPSIVTSGAPGAVGASSGGASTGTLVGAGAVGKLRGGGVLKPVSNANVFDNEEEEGQCPGNGFAIEADAIICPWLPGGRPCPIPLFN